MVQEVTGISDVVEVAVTRAPKVEPWMLMLILVAIILYREWKSGNLKL